MAMLSHLLAIIFSFLAPLVIWLVHKDQPEKSFVIENAKEALNFSITVFGLMIGCMIISAVIGWIPIIGWIIAILLFLVMLGVALGALVLFIMAGIKANGGEAYRYPFALRLIK